MQIIFNQGWEERFFSNLNMEQIEPEKLSANDSAGEQEFSWSDIDFDQFKNRLTIRNEEQSIAKAKKVLFDFLKSIDCKNMCIACTGSDGRKEKLSGFLSPMELMLIISDARDQKSVSKIREFVANHKELFFDKLEIKDLSKDSLIGFDRNWSLKSQPAYRPFPTRALDAHYLAGNKETFRKYQELFFDELENQTSKKNLNSFKSSSVKPTLQLMKRSASQKAISDIDVVKGSIIYNGDRIKATKYALLRPVQYKIAEHIWKLAQAKKLSQEEFLQLPKNTIDRIHWLATKRLINISPEQMTKVKKAYTAALIWLGVAQKNFELYSLQESFVPSKDLKDIARIISDFCDQKIFDVF